MDLVDYAKEVYDSIHEEFTAFAAKLRVPDLTIIPVSALKGDNVVSRSDNMPWYDGPSLLHHLENVHVASDRNLVDVRFPVQYVIRPKSDDWHDYRGYAGQVAGGVLKKGDEVMVLPSGFTSTIAAVETADGQVDEAYPPMSVTVRLEDEIDISRGDLICRPHNQPTVAQDIDAMVCWMDESATLQVGPQVRDQAHHPHGALRHPRGAVPPRRQHAAPRRGDPHPGPQRDRPGPPALDRSADGRRVLPQPHHRRVHPRRRGHQPHRRGRNDHRSVLSGPTPLGERPAYLKGGFAPSTRRKASFRCGLRQACEGAPTWPRRIAWITRVATTGTRAAMTAMSR